MSFASRRDLRALRLESLESRDLLSAVPAAAAGDTVIPIHLEIGDTALEKILGVATQIDSLENAISAYLNEVPGWHLTGGVDTTPEYSGILDGNITLGADGLLKSACVSVICSADIGGTIEGYYGLSVLHVGVGAAVDLSANLSIYASYSVTTNDWDFSGSASIDGYAKGYAGATAWPLKGEIYVRGDVVADAGVNSDTGIASASITVIGSVGANAQMKSLFGGWKTIASCSKTLGSYEYEASYDVGSWIKSTVGNISVSNQQLAIVNAALASFVSEAAKSLLNSGILSSTTNSATADTADSLAMARVAETTSVANAAKSVSNVSNLTTNSSTTATPSSVATSLQTAAIVQLSETNLLNEYVAA